VPLSPLGVNPNRKRKGEGEKKANKENSPKWAPNIPFLGPRYYIIFWDPPKKVKKRELKNPSTMRKIWQKELYGKKMGNLKG